MARLPLARVAGGFLVGQVLIQVANVGVGLLLVRALPVREFALYSIGLTLLTFYSMGAGLGVPHALLTIASRVRGNLGEVGSALAASLMRIKIQLWRALLVIVPLGAAMLWRGEWSLGEKALCLALVLIGGIPRVTTTLLASVFNAHHSAKSLFKVGMTEAAVRLATAPLCLFWPAALLALAVNVLGATIARYVARYEVARFASWGVAANSEHDEQVRAISRPLTWVALYAAAQGQLAILLLGLAADAQSIAEFGAVTRLNQLLSFATMFNPFLVQPILARQVSRRAFIQRSSIIMLAISGMSAGIMLSGILFPSLWLAILGAKYDSLSNELLITLATGCVTIWGATLYTMVISRGEAKGQSYSIAPSLVGQLLFVGLHGVKTASDALIVNLIPQLVYVVVQALLLGRVLVLWADKRRRDASSETRRKRVSW